MKTVQAAERIVTEAVRVLEDLGYAPSHHDALDKHGDAVAPWNKSATAFSLPGAIDRAAWRLGDSVGSEATRRRAKHLVLDALEHVTETPVPQLAQVSDKKTIVRRLRDAGRHIKTHYRRADQ